MYSLASQAASPPEARQARPRRRRGADGARRTLLLETTLRLIADRGIDAISHRSVADAAGVPLGSTTYWFASRQDMLIEALEHFARLETETLRDRLSGVLGKRLSRARLVDELTAILLPQVGEGRWRALAQYTLLQEAARQPELEAACREWTAAWEDALTEVFGSMCADDPELEARMFLAMLDGLLLGQLATPVPDVENAVIRPWLEAWLSRVPTSDPAAGARR